MIDCTPRLVTLLNIKHPTHYFQREGHGVPSVVVCPLWYIMVGRVKCSEIHLATVLYSPRANKDVMMLITEEMSIYTLAMVSLLKPCSLLREDDREN